MRMLAIPIRRSNDTLQLATVEVGSPEADAQQVAAVVQTALGERPLWPTFGTHDGLWSEFGVAPVQQQLITWGPPVEVRMQSSWESTTEESVTLYLRRLP